MSLKYVHYVVSAYDGATLRKIEGLGFIETVVTLRQHAKKLYKSVWFSQRVLHYPLTCKCSSSITKIIDKALTFFFKAGMACLLTYLLCAKVFPTLLEYLHLQTNLLKSFSISLIISQTAQKFKGQFYEHSTNM